MHSPKSPQPYLRIPSRHKPSTFSNALKSGDVSLKIASPPSFSSQAPYFNFPKQALLSKAQSYQEIRLNRAITSEVNSPVNFANTPRNAQPGLMKDLTKSIDLLGSLPDKGSHSARLKMQALIEQMLLLCGVKDGEKVEKLRLEIRQEREQRTKAQDQLSQLIQKNTEKIERLRLKKEAYGQQISKM